MQWKKLLAGLYSISSLVKAVHIINKSNQFNMLPNQIGFMLKGSHWRVKLDKLEITEF